MTAARPAFGPGSTLPAVLPGDHIFPGLPLFDPSRGETVFEPEAPGAGYWVGAPGLVRDAERNRYLLVYRRRRPRGVEPDRGYTVRIAESADGLRFRDIWSVGKAAFGTTSMERCSLVRVPDGPWRLYVSYVDPTDNRWRIDVVEGETPESLDVGTARVALTASQAGTEGVKDPWVFRLGNLWHMLVSYAAPRPLVDAERQEMHATADGYNTGLLVAPTGLATSEDGLTWRWEREILAVSEPGAWDGYQSRLNCLFYRAPAWIGLYDGSASAAGNYEERTGIAYSFDLRHWHKATLSGPALVSPHASGSLRYVDVVALPDRLWFYYEYARSDGAHELRRSEVRL